MYPDLLGIFGVTLYGPIFERFLWGALSCLMVWGIVSSVQIYKKGRKGEGIIQGIIVVAILIWGGMKFFSTFSPDYALMFHEPLVLHSYAFCVLVGVTLGIFTAMAIGKRRGIDGPEIAKLCLMLIILGFLGARLGHVIVDWEPYWNACFHPDMVNMKEPDCLRVLNFAEGGLTFYGGVIVGMVVIAWYLIRRYRRGQKVAVLEHLDALGSALAISHAFGRLGCLAAGCCWGAVTTGSIGIRYGANSFAFAELANDPQYHDLIMKTGETPLMHATQLYEAGGELLIYGMLWLMLMKGAKPGKMAGIWLMTYGVLRFIVEMMRDDSERGYYFEKVYDGVNEFLHVVPGHSTILSTSQGIGIVMFVLGLGLYVTSVCISKGGHGAEEEADGAVSAKKEEVGGRMEPEAT